MKRAILLSFSIAACLGLATEAGATVLTFDDLPACSGICGAIGAYGGFTWSSDFNYMNTPTYNAGNDDGYKNGTVSGEYVAFNAFGNDVQLSGGGVFDFTGAYLTAAWRNGLEITVEGFNGAVLLYSTTIMTDYNPATWFQFDYLGIDRLTFHSSGGVEVDGLNGSGAHFAMDNFTVNESPIPEPGTLLLVGSGLLGLAARRRRS